MVKCAPERRVLVYKVMVGGQEASETSFRLLTFSRFLRPPPTMGSQFDGYVEEWSQIKASVLSKLDNDLKQQAGGKSLATEHPPRAAPVLTCVRCARDEQSNAKRPSAASRWNSRRRTRSYAALPRHRPSSQCTARTTPLTC